MCHIVTLTDHRSVVCWSDGVSLMAVNKTGLLRIVLSPSDKPEKKERAVPAREASL